MNLPNQQALLLSAATAWCKLRARMAGMLPIGVAGASPPYAVRSQSGRD